MLQGFKASSVGIDTHRYAYQTKGRKAKAGEQPRKPTSVFTFRPPAFTLYVCLHPPPHPTPLITQPLLHPFLNIYLAPGKTPTIDYSAHASAGKFAEGRGATTSPVLKHLAPSANLQLRHVRSNLQ